MGKARAAKHGSARAGGFAVTASAGALFLLWLLLTGSGKASELILGVVTTLCAAVVLASLLNTRKLVVHLQLRDLALCWRVPGDILRDCYLVTKVLCKDLAGVERAGSFYRACGFQSGKRNPLRLGRGALAVMYSTMSPNMLVIGIDPDQSLMIFHQLQREVVPEVARRLGAQR